VKLLVETTGNFELLVPENGEYIRGNGATVVHSNHFVQSRIAKGELNLIENLVDEATDQEYIDHVAASSVKDGDYSFANESFLSTYGEKSSEKVEKKIVAPKVK
jgi:hypothetical protein